MNTLNAAVSALSELNFFQPHFRPRWHRLPLFALFLMLALLASRTAYATTYTVTDLTDSASDTGSLRYAINTAVDGDTILFAPNVIGTISLTNGTITIAHSITITGPGPSLLTISGSNNGANVGFRIDSGIVNISGLTFANSNTVFGGGGYVGGAMYNNATLTLSYCAISNNTGGDGAGAIGNQGTLTIDNCTISNNTANMNVGGAIVNDGTLTVENSTITGNKTSDGNPGGGIENRSTLTVENSTIVGNTAGGGIDNGPGMMGPSTATIANSIVAGNTGGDCNQCGTQSANNLIGGTPDLGPLQYNGGDTETMMPLPGSPAIGSGLLSLLPTDQRGFARSIVGASDLGAVQTNYLTVTTLADSSDAGTCTGGATCSLRDAIALSNSFGSGDIVFQSGLTGTILLGSLLPQVTADTSLAGPGASHLTISGPQPAAGDFLILNIPNTNTAVNLRGVTITGGTSQLSGPGGISNNGRLSVENSWFSYNTGDTGGAISNSGVLGVKDSTFSNDYAASGGGIHNSGSLVVANSTFTGNRDYNGNGGGIENSGAAIVYDSTITGNNSLNGGVGAGMDNSSGSLAVTNSIVAANINLNGNTEDDCNNCTQNGPMLTGATPNLGALAYNGLDATVQTILPLPGSGAIQAGDPTLMPLGLTTDQRGFPRTTGGKLDVGATQTNYTAIQFVQQPTSTASNADISPAVTLKVLETNTNLSAPNNTDPVDGVPITLTLNGSGTLGGTLTQTTSGGVASFGDLTVNAVGTGNTLATSLTVTPTGVTPPVTLTATSSAFDVTLQTQTINFTPPPANVTYGVPPITLVATSSASLPVLIQVDSGPATINGNVLTITGAGTVLIEADAAGNGAYHAAAPVTETIQVGQAASSVSLTTSSSLTTPGTSVTLTATVTSATPGTTATPSGTVTFLTAAGPLGTANLNAQGVATLAVTTLPAGSTAIEASYSGDANFIGSGGQLAAPIVIGSPTFTMTSNVSSLSIQPGQTGTVTLTLTPSYGYTGTVNFACNSLPLHSTCSFSPSSATFSGSATPVTVTLTVATSVKGQARSKLARLTPLHPLRSMPILPAIFFWLPGSRLALEEDEQNRQPRMKKKSFRMLLAALLLVLGAGMFSLTGCGDGTPFGTPAGSQTVTVTATGSGGVSQSIAVQMSVQ